MLSLHKQNNRINTQYKGCWDSQTTHIKQTIHREDKDHGIGHHDLLSKITMDGEGLHFKTQGLVFSVKHTGWKLKLKILEMTIIALLGSMIYSHCCQVIGNIPGSRPFYF